MVITRENVNGHRWYDDGTSRGMSVTTVLKYLDEDTTGLDIWKAKNDGSDDAPYWEHLLWYAQHRGTLCHHDALCQLHDPRHNGLEDEALWSADERQSLAAMKRGRPSQPFHKVLNDQDADAPNDKRAILYSVLKKKGVVNSRWDFDQLIPPTLSLLDVLYADSKWFVAQFNNIRQQIGLTQESVIRIEQFLLDAELKYGGQCDVLYEDRDGNNVLLDLKTSSGLRRKARLQTVAYSKAVERDDSIDVSDVDRGEVLRIAPDDKEVQVHSSYVPERYVGELYDPQSTVNSTYTDKYWFKDRYGNFEYADTEAMWQEFLDCIGSATDKSDSQSG